MNSGSPIMALLERPLIPFLSNTDPPAEAHVKFAKKRLGEAEERLQALNHTIEGLHVTLQELMEEATQVSELCGAYRLVSAPIRRVPPEIIVQIITKSLPPDCVLDHEGRLDFMRYRCVCSLWRNLLFSTPTFWRGLKIPYSDSQMFVDLETLTRWFHRGGPSAPLTIVPDGPVSYPLSPVAEIIAENIPFINTHGVWKEVGLPIPLMSQSFQSESYYATGTALRLLRAVTDGQSKCWESLRVLHMSVHIPPNVYFTKWPFRTDGRGFASVFPRLEQLNIVWDNKTPVSIFHPSLTDLRLALHPGASTQCVLDVIFQFPRLTHLALLNASPGKIYTDPYEGSPEVTALDSLVRPVQLQYLRRLELTVNASFVLAFTHYLQTPVLDTVHLACGDAGTATPDVAPLVAFLHRCPSVVAMVFEEDGVALECVGAVIRASTSLRQLYITGWRFLSEFRTNEEYQAAKGDLPQMLCAIYHPKLSRWDVSTEIIPFFRARMARRHSSRAGPEKSGRPSKIAIVYEDLSDSIEDFAVEPVLLASLDITIAYGVCGFL
ncbi:hypothetical protein FA15DRAFT_754704 [Coprinopsis marcescibilis]|uniref:Uncharacterized protein n=1 Tax=Coprinopsis marcescibilis TaxID=230819 RepID=A0A5C3L298_COPMA|nr:hypothetical protein FA15DRAFT_754704 [Coprinopsis marcescibilis]